MIENELMQARDRRLTAEIEWMHACVRRLTAENELLHARVAQLEGGELSMMGAAAVLPSFRTLQGRAMEPLAGYVV
jgi:hypothetical protein